MDHSAGPSGTPELATVALAVPASSSSVPAAAELDSTEQPAAAAPAPPLASTAAMAADAPAAPAAAAADPSSSLHAAPSSAAASSSTAPVLVFDPAVSRTPSDIDDAFFEPTLADVQAHHAGVLARSARLNDAPLLTSKHRDEARAQAERTKAARLPTTTIRVRFSDGTQIQRIQPVYAFVRAALAPAASSSAFTLTQPPRTTYPEHPPPAPSGSRAARGGAPSRAAPVIPPAHYGPVKGGPVRGLQGGTGGGETLAELGLVPQSVLVVRWADDAMNASSFPAPLTDELRAKSVPLPPAGPQAAGHGVAAPLSGGDAGKPAEKKMPKWLTKGLMKKK